MLRSCAGVYLSSPSMANSCPNFRSNASSSQTGMACNFVVAQDIMWQAYQRRPNLNGLVLARISESGYLHSSEMVDNRASGASKEA